MLDSTFERPKFVKKRFSNIIEDFLGPSEFGMGLTTNQPTTLTSLLLHDSSDLDLFDCLLERAP